MRNPAEQAGAMFRVLEPSWLEVVIRKSHEYSALLIALKDCEQYDVGHDKLVIRITFGDDASVEALRPALSDRNIYCGLAYEATGEDIKQVRLEVYDQNGVPVAPYGSVENDTMRWVKQKLMMVAVQDDRGYVAAWQLNFSRAPVLHNVILGSFDYRAGALGKLVGMMNLFKGF